MGGAISVSSRLGEGSEFVFEIPATGATEAPQNRQNILAGRRAVIVSKNAVEADAIARTIRAHGGAVDVAATAAQATPFAEHCDALLIDAAMEDSDGRLLKRLRQSGFADCEAITLIAPTDRGMLGEFRASGYATFLARPVRGETLMRVLLTSHAPALPLPKKPEKSGASSLRAAGARHQGLSVLIAEDNDINAMLARATLLKAGHRVKVVGNGKAAVEAITEAGLKHRFDVVLMDLHMPVMDGLDAIAAIRRHEEEMAVPPVPIMVLSADSQEKTRHTVLAHGASGFVTKPLDPDALVHAVEGQVAA
jgi:CheY-like chemotaxis protein